MPKETYDQVYDDEPFELKQGKNVLKLMCCDCCLVHDVSVRVTKTNKIKLTINRNNKATAQARRHHKKELECIKNENKKRGIRSR